MKFTIIVKATSIILTLFWHFIYFETEKKKNNFSSYNVILTLPRSQSISSRSPSQKIKRFLFVAVPIERNFVTKLKITRGWSTDFITDPWQTSIGGTVYGGALAMHIYACRTPSLASCIAYLTPCGRDTAPRWWDTTRRGVMHFSERCSGNCDRHWYASFASALISKFPTFFRCVRVRKYYSFPK